MTNRNLLYWCTFLLMVSAFSHSKITSGELDSNGICVFPNYKESFIWNSILADRGSFYYVQNLNETELLKPLEYPSHSFVIPQIYINARYNKPQELSSGTDNVELSSIQSAESRDPQKRYAYYDNLWDVPLRRKTRRMVVFHEVLSNKYGLIVHPRTCEYVRNGGCTYMTRSSIYRIDKQATSFNLVVSLTAGAYGTWHFPMEIFVALAALPKPYMEKAIFHVPKISPYIKNWFSLLEIPIQRLSSAPTILAQTLLVPQQGLCCEIYETQIEWLRRDVARLPSPHISHKRQIILVKRSGSRYVSNAVEVEQTAHLIAKAVGYQVVSHDDRKLPSLVEQIHLFAQSPIVIAPHGAGLLFTAFSPENACIVEFMPEGFPMCYARLAYLRRLNYTMHLMNETQIRIVDFNASLAHCIDSVEAHMKISRTTYLNSTLQHIQSKKISKLSTSTSSHDRLHGKYVRRDQQKHSQHSSKRRAVQLLPLL